MEPGGFFQSGSDREAESCRVRALRPDGRDGFVVKFAQRVEDAARLLRFVPGGAEVMDGAVRELGAEL